MPPRKRKEAAESVQDAVDQGEMSTRLASSKKDVIFIIIVVVVVLAAVGLMVANAVKGRKGVESGPEGRPVAQVQNVSGEKPKIAIGKEDIKGLISRVSELIVIKSDEQPTVATIQDATLAKQSNPLFYKDAENGDRLLVWSDKAVLYSTAKDKLLAVIPINPGDIPPSASGGPQPSTTSTQDTAPAQGASVQSENAQIEVLNGTTVAGLAKSMSTKLKEGGLAVVKATDATLKDYTKNVIINVSGKELPETMKALAGLISAEVVSPPVGENKLGGDITVIVGVTE